MPSSNIIWGVKAVAAIATVAVVVTIFGRLSNEEHDYNRAAKAEDHHITGRDDRVEGGNWSNTHFFINKDGLAIFWQRWLPIKGFDPAIKAIIVISHGLAEHSGRYDGLANKLKALGYAVYALDHQGHGQSEGTRGYVKAFMDFPADVIQLTKMAKEKNPLVKKVFLLGHSMGSLISIHTVNAAPDLFDGVVLSAPPLAADLPPGTKEFGPMISKYLPKLPGPPIEGLHTLSRDPHVVDRYYNDPLVAMGSNKFRLLAEIIDHMDIALDSAKDFPIPYILMHGTSDGMCLHRGSEEFHSSTNVDDKTFISIDGAFHELFNEPDADENAIREAIKWLEKH